MKYSKLTDQASDVASTVGDTLTDAVSVGLDRGRDLVSTAADRLPDPSTASDWTRQHVPGLKPPKSRGLSSWLPLIGAIAVVAAVVWWLRRDTDADSITR
ncbi:MAG: hypothetical protein H0U01_08890 [Acidimicrobiia bacterium]|nr:hypothetical protein [Acidimicrobiia bacterium]